MNISPHFGFERLTGTTPFKACRRPMLGHLRGRALGLTLPVMSRPSLAYYAIWRALGKRIICRRSTRIEFGMDKPFSDR
jgi:hypothetical protein